MDQSTQSTSDRGRPNDSDLDADKPVTGPRRNDSRARIATSFVFFLFGFLTGTWGTRIPAIKDQTGLSDGELGLALLAAPLGVVAMMQVWGHVVHRFGSGPTTRLTVVSTFAIFPLTALPDSGIALAAALFAAGATWGMLDSSMNTQASTIEHRYGRSIMSSIHGYFSLGALTGGLAGGLAAYADWSPLAHFSTFSLLALLASGIAGAWLLPGDVDAGTSNDEPASISSSFNPRSRRLLQLGVITFCAFIGEGAAYDWSAVHLHEALGAEPAVAALGVAAFSLSMCVCRFAGDRVITRFGRETVLRYGGLIAGIGLVSGLLANSILIGLVGWIFFGIGLSSVAPITFASAGSTPGVSRSKAIARVAGIGWAGVLIGPPLVGGVSEMTNLDVALSLVACMTLLICVLASTARTRPSESTAGTASPAAINSTN